MKKSVRITLVLMAISISACQQDDCPEGVVSEIEDESLQKTDSLSATENMLEFILAQKDNQLIEFPTLYDELCTEIADDSAESLILAEHLKDRGFEVINWGRGNFPPRGARIVILTMQRETCFCEVSKTYLLTTLDNHYQLSEQIRCADSVAFYQTND